MNRREIPGALLRHLKPGATRAVTYGYDWNGSLVVTTVRANVSAYYCPVCGRQGLVTDKDYPSAAYYYCLACRHGFDFNNEPTVSRMDELMNALVSAFSRRRGDTRGKLNAETMAML